MNSFLLVSGIYPPDIGGPARFIPSFANFLKTRNLGVSVVTLTDQTKDFKVNEEFLISYVSRKRNLLLRMLKMILEVRRLAVSHTVVIANGCFYEAGIALLGKSAIKIAKVVGDPVWERFRNESPTNRQFSSFNQTNLPFKFRLERKLLVWTLNRFDFVYCPSQDLCEVIKSWGVKRPIIYIPNGTKCLPKPKVIEKFDVAVVSRLVSWKNIDLVIRACSVTNKSLIIAGTGPEYATLKALSKELGSKTEFVGAVSSSQTEEILSSASIYVLPSNYEGMSFTLLEAMMLGRRIVVSNIPGNVNVIQHLTNGIVLPELTLEKFTEALNLVSGPIGERLGIKAREDALNKYCEQLMFENLLKCVKEYGQK